MLNDKRTEISELGKFGLIEKLTANFESTNLSTVTAAGDDAAVLDTGSGSDYTLLSTNIMLEGIDFDLTYFPLKHLGWKTVVVTISNILAMNGLPRQIAISLGISAKFSVEHIEELYDGVKAACDSYGLDLVGGDLSSSVTGMVISVTAVGTVGKSGVTYRKGAQETDIICVTGNLGAAYMGLHLLEREKRALEGVVNPEPRFAGYEYILKRQLRPDARLDIISSLRESSLVPTSMTDLSSGLASGLLQLCRASDTGARIYLDRIPIAKETYAMAEELNADPVVAALNGGGDYELLFTVPLDQREKIGQVGGIDVIGHITAQNTGTELVLPDGTNVALTAPGIR